MTLEHENPFCMGELENLGFAQERGDIDYLKAWSREAVKKFEADANRDRGDAIKWRTFISRMCGVVDRDDLADLEFGPDE